MQFHWQNPGYKDFDDFLGHLTQLAPIQVERLLFSLLMGAGLVAAWQLLFAEVEEPAPLDVD